MNLEKNLETEKPVNRIERANRVMKYAGYGILAVLGTMIAVKMLSGGCAREHYDLTNPANYGKRGSNSYRGGN